MDKMEHWPFEKFRNAVFDEISGSVRKGPACNFLFKKATEELRQKKNEGPYCALFYEVAFCYLDESAVRLAYSLWKPVVARLIARYDPQLLEQNAEDTVVSYTNRLFEIMFRAVLRGNLENYLPGVVNSYMKTAVMREIYERHRKKKRSIISNLKKRRSLLDHDDRSFLEKNLLPGIESIRPPHEAVIFRLFVLEQKAVNDMLGECELLSVLEKKNDRRMALHNLVSTVIWNAFKLLDRESRDREKGNSHEMIVEKWRGR